jgi:hypothetical protein
MIIGTIKAHPTERRMRSPRGGIDEKRQGRDAD